MLSVRLCITYHSSRRQQLVVLVSYGMFVCLGEGACFIFGLLPLVLSLELVKAGEVCASLESRVLEPSHPSCTAFVLVYADILHRLLHC